MRKLYFLVDFAPRRVFGFLRSLVSRLFVSGLYEVADPVLFLRGVFVALLHLFEFALRSDKEFAFEVGVFLVSFLRGLLCINKDDDKVSGFLSDSDVEYFRGHLVYTYNRVRELEKALKLSEKRVKSFRDLYHDIVKC